MFITRLFKPKCFWCGSSRIRREDRNGWLETTFLPLIGLYPFHCGKCKRNFYLALRHLRSGGSKRHHQMPSV